MNPYSYLPIFGFYAEPTIVSFTPDPPIADMGASLDDIILRWAFDKDMKFVTVAGNAVSPFVNELTVPGPLTQSTRFTLKCGDGTNTANGSCTLQFLNRMYWGYCDSAPTDSDGVMALDYNDFISKLDATLLYGANGRLPCFAFPTRLGILKRPSLFQTGVLNNTLVQTPFTAYTQSTVSVTNGFGFTEDYTVVVFNAIPTDNATEVRWR